MATMVKENTVTSEQAEINELISAVNNSSKRRQSSLTGKCKCPLSEKRD